MSLNRSMPPGVIIPEIPYKDVNEAADWLCRAFGFKKRLQIGNHRFQLTFGDASIIVIQEDDSNQSASVMIHVNDVNGRHERAKSIGAQTIHPPADHPFGERQYTVKDPGGHRWSFSQTISDADPQSWGGKLFK